MSDSDTSSNEVFEVDDYETYRARKLGQPRKDGKPQTEANVKWGYKRYYGLQKARFEKKQKEKQEAKRARYHSPQPTTSTYPEPTGNQTSEEEENTQQRDYREFINAQSIQEESQAMEVDRVKRDTSGNSDTYNPGSSASNKINNDIKYISAAKAGIATFAFEHVHLINSWGNAYSIYTPGTELETKVMLTSLACLPVTAVCFWMSYAEYKSLPIGTRIISVECIVTPKGFKTSFDTGVSITSSANNTQGVFGQCAVGLNRKLLLRNYEVKRNSTQPMKIDSIEIPNSHDISERLWGHHIYDDAYDKSVPTCFGIPRAMKLYAGIMQPYKKADANTQVTAGWPDFIKHLKMFNYLDHIDTPVVHYFYKVKTNVLKPKETKVDIDDAANHIAVMGGEDISLYKGTVTKDNFTITRINKLNSVKKGDVIHDTYTTECVEHCHTVSILDHTPPNSGHPQPSLHIGILPIQTNAPDKELQEYVTACATWEIKTRIVLMTDYHQDYIHNSIYAHNKIPFGVKQFDVNTMYNNSTLGFAPG